MKDKFKWSFSCLDDKYGISIDMQWKNKMQYRLSWMRWMQMQLRMLLDRYDADDNV